ncbi:TIGR03643 family protein [Bernardetia sp. Wsw4-3y2]|uniref:TIGR03643 family protein n=1 Tax=Bernardetia sp. Wsw4-3y2 TaxID=3127471 RepID=UPI0030D3228C
MKKLKQLSERDTNRVIEMAWEDRTPFDAILSQFNLTEKETITLMRREMKPSSFRMWRKRVQGRSTKHKMKAANDLKRFKCSLQKTISLNKISKR